MKVLFSVGCLGLLLVGCVSGAGEFQWRYHEQYTQSQKNRQGLLNMRLGMSPDQVRAVIGEPQMIEGYPRETVWYYHQMAAGSLESSTVLDTVAMQRHVRQQDLLGRSGRGADTNFTRLVFDERQRLIAWGRDTTLPAGLPSEAPVRSLP